MPVNNLSLDMMESSHEDGHGKIKKTLTFNNEIQKVKR
jgi:hypothetical protein